MSVRETALAVLATRLRALAGPTAVHEQGALAPYTTWRVGGTADLLFIAERGEQLLAAASAASALELPWRVLGNGSNVLVRDGGVEGLVILNRARSLTMDGQTARADTGLLLSTLARRTAALGLAGLEWSAGIPGSVGGAIVSNAGAHGGEMAATLQRVLIGAPGAPEYWEDAAALRLTYRHSRLRLDAAPLEIVVAAEFALRPDAPEAIRARMDEQKRQRKATQPLAQASAGSVFKNPPGGSAGRLIEQAGLKGLCIGGAQVSQRHANFMVTDTTASAADLLALIAMVQDRVRTSFGVDLILEVQPIGRETPARA